MSAIPEIPIDEPIPLPRRGSWPAAVHVFDKRSANAIRMALAAERPLLVRGEPGIGKSQLARAAAEQLGRLFVSEVVHARSEPADLQWRFDAVARLGEAQALGAGGPAAAGEDTQSVLAPDLYLSPGPLWWTFDWDSADAQHQRCRHPGRRPEPPAGWEERPAAERGAVVLIDEIDKAEADLPNGLLETLGNGAFPVPYRHDPVSHAAGPPPLVVITTNEERELPGAFQRRCLVLQLTLPPDDSEALIDRLMDRGAKHFPDIHADVRREAAVQLQRDRKDARRYGITPPGQAEYLDMLRALHAIAPGTSKARVQAQLDLLQEIAEFALRKGPRQS